MIGVDELQTFLINNPEQLFDILEKMEFNDIKDRGNYITFPNKDGDNKNACVVYKDTLIFKNYTRAGQDGNIFTLVMNDQNISFKNALRKISEWLGLQEAIIQIKRPFGGFYKHVIRPDDRPELSMKTYDESILFPYMGYYNKKFFNDGIDYLTQEEFNIGYSFEDNAILIPAYTVNGDLCGCKARNNDPNCLDSKRWWAFIPYSKTYTLFGFHRNYANIVKSRQLFIAESEKAVMQARSMGFDNVLAVCGSKISNMQQKYIKSLMCDTVVVGFDEGLFESDILLEAEKLIPKGRKCRVGYIFDSKNEILIKGSKDSPTDVGREKLKELMATKVRWLS